MAGRVVAHGVIRTSAPTRITPTKATGTICAGVKFVARNQSTILLVNACERGACAMAEI
jgi:hypothetical protein